jgi:predicted AAA+ superfamily ATPase
MENAEIITRNLYLQKVQPHIGKPVIKVLTGHRRSGKSYLMMNIMDYIRQTDPESVIIYVSKEHYEFDHIRDYHDLQAFFDEKYQAGKNNYFFVDEIQEIDEFEKCIRNILSKQLADIFISGSNADMLSGELASMLSGRYIEIKVHPLSYHEFLGFFGFAHSADNFNRYLRQGGMPGLINIHHGQEPVNDYLKGIFSTVLLKDVVARYNIRNVAFLESLVRFVSVNTGSLVSAKNISDYLKSQRIAVSPNLVLDYLGYLCNACLINKVLRKDIEGKKVFEVGEKYYFEDTGLRNTASGFNPADIGKVLENVVYNHLVIAGYDVFVGKQGVKEVDFVAERGGETTYIQVCYLLSDDKVIEREFGNLLSIPDNYRKLVVSMDNWQPGNTYKGIEHRYIPDFCLGLVQ